MSRIRSVSIVGAIYLESNQIIGAAEVRHLLALSLAVHLGLPIRAIRALPCSKVDRFVPGSRFGNFRTVGHPAQMPLPIEEGTP